MNRQERRWREKQISRASKVSAAKKTAQQQEAQQRVATSLDGLMLRAKNVIEDELKISREPGFPVDVKHLVLAVFDGTSPIAPEEPPEFRQFGSESYAARLMARDEVAGNRAMGALGAVLSKPSECGHLQYIVSTDVGTAITCVTCNAATQASAQAETQQPGASP